MCGFLAEFTFENQELTAHNDFKALLARSKHRGPDSTEISLGENYQLGFNRLAILDLSAHGNQPKYSPSKRYHVVFNGEIYNYKSLKQTHKLTNLKSTSDTEVLVHLLDLMGVEQTLTSLHGMFAISIVDTADQCMYLARDFAGIKPLFYGMSKNGVVAASQFNQVFHHAWFKNDLKLRPAIMKEYFGFGYMSAPNTIYQDIFQVAPGNYIKITSEGVLETHVFKNFNENPIATLTEDDSNTLTNLNNTLETAVKEQLVSDVPLATFLSGGIDSPLIAAIAKHQNTSIKAYTMAVSDAQLDESKEATAYAKHVNIDHHVYKFEERELLENIDAHFKHLSEPFGDYSSIPTYLISQKARIDNTVMLSGDGGDELFFGYPRMLDVLNKRWWFNIPFFIRKPIIRLLNKLGIINTWAPYHYKTISDFIKAKHQYIFKSDLNGFLPDVIFSEELNNLYTFKDDLNKNALLKALRHNEFYGHLQRVLVKVDRMSMANSLEVRVPFLDKNTIDLAWNIQPNLGTKHRVLKKLLKAMMGRYYPKSLIYTKKKGFAVPIDHWLRNELKADVEKVVFETPFYGQEFMDVDTIKAYVTRFYNKEHDAAWGVWHIYAWQKWAIAEGLV